jgi:hypothetical protein
MSHRLLSSFVFIAAAALAGCTTDPISPTAARPVRASALLGPNEGVRVLTDSVDANGNTTLVQEFGMGVYTLPNGDGGTVASVIIRTFIPNVSPTSSSYCLTHSIVSTEAIEGIKLTIKKSGGCNKDIEILIEQPATKQKATFRFSMVPGKTVIDSGLLR